MGISILKRNSSRNHEGSKSPMVGSNGTKKPRNPVPGLESGAAVGEVDITLSCIPNQPHVAAAKPSGGKWLVILKAGGKWLSWVKQVGSEQIWLPEVQNDYDTKKSGIITLLDTFLVYFQKICKSHPSHRTSKPWSCDPRRQRFPFIHLWCPSFIQELKIWHHQNIRFLHFSTDHPHHRNQP